MSQASTTDRVAVKTYVPSEQKEIWEGHAAEMAMTLSEFVRTMVQAGRAPFTIPEDRSADANPGGDDLETAILNALQQGPRTFEELSEEIIGELEIELDDTLAEMEEVKHSGRTNEYRLKS